MAKPQTYPPGTQLEVVATRVAHISNVPAHEEREFSQRLIQTVLAVRARDRRTTGEPTGGALIEAADAARILYKKFSGMNKQDREWVKRIQQSQIQFQAGRADLLEIAILNIATVLHAALGKPFKGPNPLGLTQHVIRDQILRELIFRLWSDVEEARGKLTFNKNSAGGGSLAQALELLRPYLPRGLLPDPLQTPTIQRLVTDYRRLRAL